MTSRKCGNVSMLAHGAKNEIIESAIEIVSKKGSWDISVKEIADECKITSASLYTYFSSKSEIIKDAKIEMEKRFSSIINLPIPEKIPEEMKIRMISFYIFDFVVKNRWASEFIDPFSEYESTKELMKRIRLILKKSQLSKDELDYRIYRFLAGISFKIKFRFMRNELPIESDIDDLSRFMSYSESFQ